MISLILQKIKFPFKAVVTQFQGITVCLDNRLTKKVKKRILTFVMGLKSFREEPIS